MRRSSSSSQLLVAAVGTLLLALTLVGLAALLVPRDGQPVGLVVGDIMAVAAAVLGAASCASALLGWVLSRLRDLRCGVVVLLSALFLALLAWNP